MKVSVELSTEYSVPYAVIYADKVTSEVQRMLDAFGRNETPIIALQNEDNLVILQPDEIYMVRVEGGDTIIFGESRKYRSRKRLYELEQQLGQQFMQISKSTLISMGMSLGIFCFVGMVFDIYFGGNFTLVNYQFTKMVTGCVVYTLVAHAVGWTYGSTTWAQEAMIIAVQLFVAFLIWFVFMQYYRREARETNDKIQALKG